MVRAVRVAIVGGGVMGVSIAFHLAEAGVSDVLVLERDTLGSGSSAKPLGGVRATFSDPGNIALGLRSLRAYERSPTDIGLRQVGYLFLCRTEAELAAVALSVQVQNALGCDSRMVSPAQAARLNPLLDPEALVGASFSPRDGFAEPRRVVAGYADAAQALGAVMAEQTEVLDLVEEAGGYTIRTTHGDVRAETVVITAGAWSQRLGALVGLHLPVEPVRRQIGFVRQEEAPYPTIPFTLDLSTTLYFHNNGSGLLLGISNRDQQAGFDREFDHSWTSEFDAAARAVAPSLAGRTLIGGWAGLYENTPDHNALIGRAGKILYATGFSGHGFLQAPAVGEILRDLYLGRVPFLDPAPFSAARFERGRQLSEVHII